jgi:uroporphyrinogen decarboxylase
VDELFDDLIEIGVDCFNPFHPEVMDVFSLLKRYLGRLVFHGGLSTQKTLLYRSVENIISETRQLIEAGWRGVIFYVLRTTSWEMYPWNILAFIGTAQEHRG